jgi:hypothetical protein
VFFEIEIEIEIERKCNLAAMIPDVYVLVANRGHGILVNIVAGANFVFARKLE